MQTLRDKLAFKSGGWRIEGTQPPAMHVTLVAAKLYVRQLRDGLKDPVQWAKCGADLDGPTLLPMRGHEYPAYDTGFSLNEGPASAGASNGQLRDRYRTSFQTGRFLPFTHIGGRGWDQFAMPGGQEPPLQ